MNLYTVTSTIQRPSHLDFSTTDYKPGSTKADRRQKPFALTSLFKLQTVYHRRQIGLSLQWTCLQCRKSSLEITLAKITHQTTNQLYRFGAAL